MRNFQPPAAPPKITVREYLPPSQRKGLPAARWDARARRVALTIPGDPFFQAEVHYAPDTLADVTRDRLVLGKDPTTGEVVTARLLKAGKPGGLPHTPTVVITGQPEPISFGSYLIDPAVFPDPEDYNNIRYATTRGVSPDLYRFVGFARAHGKAFVGVLYIDRGPSDQNRGRNGFRFLLFRLEQETDRKGKTLWMPRVVRMPSPENARRDDPKLPRGFYDWEQIDPLDGAPLIDVAREDGDLYLLTEANHLWRRVADGTWRDTGSIRRLLPPTPPQRPGDFGWTRRTSVYLRGRWLILRSDLFGKIEVRVFDLCSTPTGAPRPARTIEWAEPRGDE